MDQSISGNKQSPRTMFTGLLAAGTAVLNLAAWTAAAADSTVYRCGPPGSQWFSQIPCAEDSEAVLIVDQHKLGDSDPAADAGTEDDGAAADNSASTASNAEAFVTQLEKQRSEQLAEIDRQIANLQNQDNQVGDSEESAVTDDENASLLATMQNTRQSIVSEYDAMIRAAQQRITKP
jgi:hypothetical protein